MAREKFQTLTEPMFYILLSLREERCGTDVMAWVAERTLLDSFQQSDMIRETHVSGRKRSYLITSRGREILEAEYRRLLVLTEDYQACVEERRQLP